MAQIFQVDEILSSLTRHVCIKFPMPMHNAYPHFGGTVGILFGWNISGEMCECKSPYTVYTQHTLTNDNMTVVLKDNIITLNVRVS